MDRKVITKFLAIATGAVMLAGAFTAGVTAPAVQVEAADSSVTTILRSNFDPVFYANKYADLKAAFGTNTDALWNHFQTHGMTEGRMMNVNFDPKAYMIAYADVATYCNGDYRKAYEHYALHGLMEGRKLTTADAINAQRAEEAKAEENKNNNNDNGDDNKDHRCPYSWCFDPWCHHWCDWDWHPTGFGPVVDPDPFFPGVWPDPCIPAPDPFIPAPPNPFFPAPMVGPVCPF